MKCPECGVWCMVMETRVRKDNTKRRRYECANGHRFTTEEIIQRQPRKRKARTERAIPGEFAPEQRNSTGNL